MRLSAVRSLLLAAVLIELTASPLSEPVRRSQPLLGTFVTITAYGEDRGNVQEAVSAAFERIRGVDKLMSVHREDSELSRVNREAAEGPVEVSEELFETLAKALKISKESGGAFDVTIRPLADLWGFIWKEYRLPTEAEMKRTLPLVDYQAVKLDAEARTVVFLKEGISIDLGGIGKGHAVDVAIEKLQERGVTAAMVKAGGDLRVIGLPPGEDAWEVQLEDPGKEGERSLIHLKKGALSTSGNYENYFVVEGVRYSHILDPRTGLPARGVAACSVTASTCLDSEAYATACFVMGPEDSLKLAGERLGIRFWIPNDTGEEFEIIENSQFP